MRGLVFTVVGALMLSACTVHSLRDQHAAGRVPRAAVAFKSGLSEVTFEDDPTLTAKRPKDPARPGTSRRELRFADLAFLEIAGTQERFEAAQTDDYRPAKRLDEDEALLVFLARNEQLRSAWRTRQAARHGHSQALFLKRLLEQLDAFVRRPDRPRPVQQLPSEESLQGRVVAADVAVADVQFEVVSHELMIRLTRSWHEARYQRRAAKILGASVALAKRLLRVVETRVAANRATTADMLRAQMRLEDLRQRLRSAKERRAAALGILAALLDLPDAPELGAPRATPELRPLAQVRDQSAARGPDVRLAAQRLARGEAMLELAERRILPELSYQLGERGGATSKEPFRASYAAGAPYLEELRDRVAAAGRALAQTLRLVPAAAERAHARLSDALRRAKLFKRTQIPLSKRALDTTEAEYRVGRRGYLDLDEAQRLWLESRLGYHAAVRDAHVAAAQLKRVICAPAETQPTQEEKKP